MICKINSVDYLIPACDVTIGWYLDDLNIKQQSVPGFYACNYLGIWQIGNDAPYHCCKSVNKDGIIACHYMYPDSMHDYYNYLLNKATVNKGYTIITVVTSQYDKILDYNNNLYIYCNYNSILPIWQKRKKLGLLTKTFINTIIDTKIYKDIQLAIENNLFKTSHFMWLLPNVNDDIIKTTLTNFTDNVFTDDMVAADKNSFNTFFINKLKGC